MGRWCWCWVLALLVYRSFIAVTAVDLCYWTVPRLCCAAAELSAEGLCRYWYACSNAGLISAQKAIANLDDERHRGKHPFNWAPTNTRKVSKSVVKGAGTVSKILLGQSGCSETSILPLFLNGFSNWKNWSQEDNEGGVKEKNCIKN
jgi:hypothetical protein